MRYEGLLDPDLLNTIKTSNIPEISLYEFARGFWGAFTGRITDEQQKRDVLAFWVQRVAGNTATSVNVIHKGSVIATIPPILSSGNQGNIEELFLEIKQAREMARRDGPVIGKPRLEATKEAIIANYKETYQQDSVADWITLYELIEGEVPSVEEIDVTQSSVTSDEDNPSLGDVEWE